VATLDADSWMSPHTIAEVLKHVYDARLIGGGTVIKLERMSVGIFCSLLVLVPYLLKRRVSSGMFWFLREPFETVGGFDESLVSVEDIDFAVRLKALGQARGQRFGTIWRQGITTSCRKFDQFGDWYFVRHPRLVKAIIEGRNMQAVNSFYYDVER
jgi:hypothetical protein